MFRGTVKKKLIMAADKNFIPQQQQQQPVMNPYYNPYQQIPYAWNPAVPPPVIMPVQGMPPMPREYQYPGAIYGAQWEDVQDLIRKQKKSKGIIINSIISTTVETQVNLSGTAKIFLGIRIGNSSFGLSRNAVWQLVINNEIIFKDVSTFFMMNDFTVNSAVTEYFSYPRPLTGTDDIQIFVSEPAAGANSAYEVSFYYL